jgi:hypothetical protein
MDCWDIAGDQLVMFGKHTVRGCNSMNCQRDLDVVELWSGVGSVATSATDNGHAAVAFDMCRIPGITNVQGDGSEDILTMDGFEKALSLVCRLRPGGLLVEAPVCSSFVFPDSARTKRKAGDFTGDETYLPVRQGNSSAMVAVFLLLVAVGRGCHVLLENPAGSTLWSYIKQFTLALHKLPTHIVDRCCYDAGPYPRLGKRYKLSGTGAWVRRLGRPCQCPGNVHQQLMHDAPKGRTGNVSLLKESASYPIAMGVHIVGLWETLGPVSAELVHDCVNAPWQGGPVVGAHVSDPWASEMSAKCHRRQSQGHSGAGAPVDVDPWSECTMSAVVDPWGAV